MIPIQTLDSLGPIAWAALILIFIVFVWWPITAVTIALLRAITRHRNR